tara:strand:- start:867 stop:3458 length:2592 start_codon:yes stop_codon:yes gene_type:complete
MIDASLLKSAVAGKDGFTWWMGRVAHEKHWKDVNSVLTQNEKLSQRVKVRIIGYHPWDDTIKEEDLPWAHVMMSPLHGSGQGMKGDTVNLMGGETCLGFFLDGDNGQQPVIIGLLARHGEVRNSMEESEIESANSNQFKPFTGFPDREFPATDSPKAKTGPVKPPVKVPPVTTPSGEIAVTDEELAAVNEERALSGMAPLPTPETATQGKVDTSDSEKGKEPGGVAMPKAEVSAAAGSFIKSTTKNWTPPSPCGDDQTSKLTETVEEFMSFANGLENAFGEFTDPITNKLVKMEDEIDRVSGLISGNMQPVINNIRDELLAKSGTKFKEFAALQKLNNPQDFLLGPKAAKASNKILDLLYCVFPSIENKIKDAIGNLLGNILGNSVNSPSCASEQFVSGILAKALDLIEKLTAPILKGIDWLTGGMDAIKDTLGKASTMGRKLFSVIKCADLKCETPKQWNSSRNGVKTLKKDNWGSMLKNVNVFKGVQKSLGNVGSFLDPSQIASLASGNISSIAGINIGGVDIGSILGATSKLTNGIPGITKLTSGLSGITGALPGLPNGGLGTIESALSMMSLFGGSSDSFSECNNKTSNPTTQEDMSPMPIGYTYFKCLPPIAVVSGNGTGADLNVNVGSDGSILSLGIVNGGSGYDYNTTASIIDNTNCGYGGQVDLTINDGTITGAVITAPGKGYMGGGPGGSGVGIVTSIVPVRPGIGYTSGDTVTVIVPTDGSSGIRDTTTGYWTPGPDGILGEEHWDIEGVFGDGPPPTGDDDNWVAFAGTGAGTTSITLPLNPTPGNGSIVLPINIPSDFGYEFNTRPRLLINSTTGRGAELSPIVIDVNQSIVDDSIKPLIGMTTSVIDCVE